MYKVSPYVTLTLLLRERVVRILHRKEQNWAQLTHISAEFRSFFGNWTSQSSTLMFCTSAAASSWLRPMDPFPWKMERTDSLGLLP